MKKQTMKTINGQELKQLFLSGANNLYNHYPEIDQLNVFPVPDGDTGMNMNLTLTSGAKEIQNRNDNDVATISASFSRGLLMGARGNSGVIASQIFKGFSIACEGKETLNVQDLAAAFAQAKTTAYKAVMRPVEGTILTVIRESSEALKEEVKKKQMSIESAFSFLLKEAKRSLEHTPDLLPVLKEVGVVDSGGAGLCVVIEGMALALNGKFVERNENMAEGESSSSVLSSPYAGAKLSEGEEGYGYCTQFILRIGKPEDGKKPFVEKKFSNFLNSHGNSVVLVRDEDIVKVHVHTLQPGSMLNYAQNYGEFLTITIENMSEEHENISHGDVATDMESNIKRAKETKKDDGPKKEFGLIAVSSGDGLDEMFKELGVDEIVSGGQTMNPSTEDFVKAIEKVNAKNIFILPNNGNIIMAAKQAAEVPLSSDDTTIAVIPSKTIPQGISALTQFAEDMSKDENVEMMTEALGNVLSGSITYAIKDTDIDGVHITKDYYMAMKDDKEILACVKNKKEALLVLLDDFASNGEKAMFTVLLGKDITKEEEESLSEELPKRYPSVDFLIRRGDQNVYSFLVGAE